MTEICNYCGNEYKLISQHWRYNEDHRPDLTEKQVDVATGLLMGDGCLNKGSSNPRLQVKMITKDYLMWLDELFGDNSNGVRFVISGRDRALENIESGFSPNAAPKEYSDVYELNTKTHPTFKKFISWYEGGDKVWPDDIKLTPTVLTHWYVSDGSLIDNHISISMLNEKENKDKIEKMFSNVNLPTPSNWAIADNVCNAVWDVDDSREINNYMDGPLPGFEYKFL